MGFLDFFRRAPAIRDAQALADFIDENAAFLVQKGLYEYARARAGVHSRILFTERAFQELIDVSRWRAYPLGLAMVAEMVEGVLSDAGGGEDRRQLLAQLRELVLGVFDRYPVPPRLDATAWAEARSELSRHLDQIGLHPRKAVKDVPVPYAERYFALMPIHEKLRQLDFPSTRSYLRISLCNIHDVFVQRVDPPAVIAALERLPA